MVWWYVIAGMVLVVTPLVLTGTWRYGMVPFRISAETMSPLRLGFDATDPVDLARINGVCGAFADGFNAMISSPSWNTWIEVAERRGATYQPFAEEGAAMGFPLRRLGRFTADGFECALPKGRPGFCYLHYVGLGFWSAMRDHAPHRIESMVSDLDPMHGMLVWDGYGFKFGFFDYDVTSLRERFEQLPAYARDVAHQGVGRSLWFRFMANADRLIDNVRAFDGLAADVAAGVGLAIEFTTQDDPQRGRAVYERVPWPWRDDVQLGMCFAYKARSINDPRAFSDAMDRLDVDAREAIRAAIAQCDTIEARLRNDGAVDGYRRWREALRHWLHDHVEYPFVQFINENDTRAGATPVQVLTEGERSW